MSMPRVSNVGEDVSMEDVQPTFSRDRANTVIHSVDTNVERKHLLSELTAALGQNTVSAPFWACLCASDIECLRTLVETARSSGPVLFSLLEDTCLRIPLAWLTKPPSERSSASSPAVPPESPASSTPSSTTSNNSRHRRKGPMKLARTRDNERCVLTEAIEPEVAHIFPHCLINPRKSPERNLENCIPDFWKLLGFFFSDDKITRWKQAIFDQDSESPRLKDGCHNMLCLNPTLHDYWGKALFALMPIKESSNRTEITVHFYRLPKYEHTRFDNIPLNQEPLQFSQEPFTGVARMTDGGVSFLKTGDAFVITTTTPETLPLPSLDLLEMQWHLQQIASMSAAAEALEESDDDDDPFDHAALRTALEPLEAESPSYLSTVEETDEDAQSTSTTKTEVSPMKTRVALESAATEQENV